MDTFVSMWVVFKYIFLGLFQGFTEPIPISSSGHLVLLQHVMGMDLEGLSFEVLVNFGSLIAVLIIYRQDIMRLLQNGVGYVFTQKKEGKSDFQFIFYLVIATIPAGVIGILFEDQIAETFSAPEMIGITLIITGIALWIIRNIKGHKGEANITVKEAIIIGLAQAVALIPGISRSGSTIVAAMLLGLKQDTALRFSFLLYIPVSLGTLLLSIEDIINDPNIDVLWIPYVLAFLASVIATYFSLKWFMNIMAKGNLKYFTYYCIVVGIIAIILL
ncbi:undecaprenyl-diphosphate phosphatase [Radiobacillus kanasensis]|uniref:undecaprenyl-diphosphate phosphatase n=1 Tax=Radiobacillus kanasensis TaxID=2844358 RepID=UPI001E52C10A|nr:undecaprenyl-diphosphate phosphatase [Radiobacillus kanasensis]UFU00555.1 undecaprenyl-diphosphate phosphatase [Radiobacillus kanasensis]